MSPTDKFFNAVRVANNNADHVRLIQMGVAFNQALLLESVIQEPGGALSTFQGVKVRENRYVPDDMAILQDEKGTIVGVLKL